MEWTFDEVITTEFELREILGHPEELVKRKTIDYIDENCRAFIEKSPFITIATSDYAGRLDVSPKGDPAGFVKILNSQTLAIPDRPGNRKADTFTNIIKNPNIGLLFIIPGIRETLRVNGTAKIVRDAHVLELLECQGKRPTFAIIVSVKEAFMHCAKCMIRSKLWAPAEELEKPTLPSLGKVLVDHSKVEISYEELDVKISNDEVTNLY